MIYALIYTFMYALINIILSPSLSLYTIYLSLRMMYLKPHIFPDPQQPFHNRIADNSIQFLQQLFTDIEPNIKYFSLVLTDFQKQYNLIHQFNISFNFLY